MTTGGIGGSSDMAERGGNTMPPDKASRKRKVPRHRLWTDHRTEVRRIIKRLVASAQAPALMRVSVSGAKYGWGMSLQDELDFRTLQAWCTRSLTGHDAMLVLSELIDKGSGEVDDFENVYVALQKSAKLESMRSKPWRFILPLTVETPKKLALPFRLRVLGKAITISDWSSATRALGKKRIDRALFRLRNCPDDARPSICMCLTGTGPDRGLAWASLCPCFDVFRGSLELAIGYGRKFLQWPEGPLRRIGHPPWMLAWNRDEQVLEGDDFQVTREELSPTRKYKLTDNVLRTVRDNIRRFIRNPERDTDVATLVIDATRLYIQALDASLYHQCFLGLWQCAESLTLGAEDKANGKRVCSRLATFAQRWKVDSVGVVDVLKALYRKRNDVVHRGMYDQVSIEDVNFLKVFCESALVWIMQKASRLRDRKELDRLFQFQGLNTAEFTSLERAVTFARKERNTKGVPA